MSSRTRKYIRVPENTTVITGVNNTYSTARKHQIDMGGFGRFVGKVDSLVVNISNLSTVSTPNELHYQISRDAAGDDILVPSTQGDISTGVTTNTKGCAAYRIDINATLLAGDDLYIFYKTDQGTCDITKSSLAWEE